MVEILSARPPTPPRTASRIVIENTDSPIAVQTPRESAFSALGSVEAAPSSRSSKKVNFSPWPKYIKPPTFASAISSAPDVKTIPPSPNSKPTKSILKATQSPIPVWSPNVDTFTTESLAMLLESVIQQLAGESMSSRLDAYMQFFGALRTYDGLPAGQKIAEKLSLITEFIQRDVNRDLANGSPLDTNLANQALKLSAAFVWHPEISTQLSEEFKVFLIDHSITSLYEAKAPKSVLTHYMSILATQNFGPKIMTGARVGRLLTVLQEITKNITGNAIVSHRLNIYQRLLGQAKSAFISQANLWMEHLIFALLHHLRDTRSKAIALGFQVATEAGPNPILSKNIRDLFDRPLEHDRKLVSEVRERMTRMMAMVDSGEHVPQIWSIIILLLRSKRWNLEQWDHFKEWVLVLQKCFNCSEPIIKAQAIVGWNRFVFAVNPNESTSRYLLKMLGKPVLSQFDRKKTDKSGAPPTQLALTSYYNLLYYTFRPSASYQHLDVIWEEYVVTPSLGIFSSVPVLSDCLSRILTSLLWSAQAKIWIEGRINDNTKMESEELPAADSRWVRSRITSILKVFERLFKASVWIDDAVGKSHVALAWNSLSNALSLASSKEITPSGESMQAVASIWSLLHRLWTAGPPSLNAHDTDTFFERFRFLSTTMIVSIGGIPFAEKLLLRNTDETDKFSAHSHPNTTQESAILHLLRIISSTAGTIAPSESYTHLVLGNIEAACNGRFSRGSRLELLQQCAELSTTKTSAIPSAAQLSEVVWNTTAHAAADALQSFPMESARGRDGSVSRDYENVIKILSFGLSFASAFKEWSHLLETFVRVVRTEKGNQAIANMIVEPMAERLMHLSAEDTYLPSTSLLSHSLSIPFMQGTGLGIDRSGIQATGHTVFPHQLLASVAQTLHGAYNNFNVSQSYGLADFIEALTSFLGAGIPQFQCQILQCLQSSLGLWLKDESHIIHVDHGVDSRILTACRALSSATINILQTSVSHDQPALQIFEPILCAGLESSHVSTAKRYVDLWTLTFGSQSFATPVTVLQAVQTAESRIQTATLPPHDGDQDTDMLPPPPQDKLDQPLHQPSQGTQLSSPVMRTEDSSEILKPTEQFHEPQLPSNLHQPTDAQIVDGISMSHKRKSHREMFSMIESLQSSSPASTPRKLGFNTPPHLRKLHGGSMAELPLTPTLAPTENEEGFIGSSPTPGTRDLAPAMDSDVLTSSHRPADSVIDPPSSPPEMQSRSPSPRKPRSKSARRRAAKARKALVGTSGKQSTVNSPATSRLATENIETPMSDAHDHDNDNTNATPQANVPSRRLRSGLGKGSGTSDTADTAEPSLIPLVDSDKTPVQQPTRKSKQSSGSKKKRKQPQSKPADTQPQQATEMPPNILPDSFMDSSEETESQIASQLGQDLELAVDMDDRGHLEQAKLPDEPSVKKRKRDEEEPSSSVRTDRRRSTRLSLAKDVVNVESSQPDASHSHHANSQPVSPATSMSPTATRRSTRSSHRKGGDNAATDSVPAIQDPIAQESTQDGETPRPSKRSRKSIRLEDQSVSAAIDSTPKSVPRDTRSRRTRSQQRASEASQPQTSSIPSEERGDTEDLPPHVDQDMVPESLITEDQVKQNTSIVSTEEATASQVSEMEQAIEPTVKPDVEMDIDMDGVQHGEIAEQTTSVATTGTQTQETHPEPKSDISERDVAQSLKNLLGEMETTTLSPSAFREVDDLLFKLRCEAQNASTRHNTSA